MDAARIIAFALHVLGARSHEEAGLAFAGLCIEDLESARLLAAFIGRMLPDSAPLWAAIIDHAAECPAGKPWRWHERDPADTANAVERFIVGQRHV